MMNITFLLFPWWEWWKLVNRVFPPSMIWKVLKFYLFSCFPRHFFQSHLLSPHPPPRIRPPGEYLGNMHNEMSFNFLHCRLKFKYMKELESYVVYTQTRQYSTQTSYYRTQNRQYSTQYRQYSTKKRQVRAYKKQYSTENRHFCTQNRQYRQKTQI